MIPVFDGHNDALTRDDGEDLARRCEGGHLDLPRMREGGMRGGIFAIFTPSNGEPSRQISFGARGSYSEPLAEPVAQKVAAAHATRIADRLLALEQPDGVVDARATNEVDGATGGGAPPVAVRHGGEAETIDGDLALPAPW